MASNFTKIKVPSLSVVLGDALLSEVRAVVAPVAVVDGAHSGRHGVRVATTIFDVGLELVRWAAKEDGDATRLPVLDAGERLSVAEVAAEGADVTSDELRMRAGTVAVAVAAKEGRQGDDARNDFKHGHGEHTSSEIENQMVGEDDRDQAGGTGSINSAKQCEYCFGGIIILLSSAFPKYKKQILPTILEIT